MKKIAVLISALVWSVLAIAQTPFESEKRNGYQGQSIENLKYQEKSFNFIAMGDFGRVGAYYQKDVAAAMGNAMVALDGEFVISVGDNFYPTGVESTQDYQWISSFENIYINPSLYSNWYVALGNHDYQGNVQAQIDYSKISKRWNMPSRYYSKVFQVNKNEKVLMVFMDTNPFIVGYQNNPKYGDLSEQNTQEQIDWLEKTLSVNDPSIKWKIVVGHHPLYSGGKRKDSNDTKDFEAKFADFFDKHKVDAYICGHEHDLQIIKPKNRYTTQFLSGAASEVRPSGNMQHTIYAAAEPGFMTFSILGKELTVQVVKADRTETKVIYTHTIKK